MLKHLLPALSGAASRLRPLLAYALLTLVLAGPAAARTYEDATRDALAQLAAANSAAAVGNVDAAGAALDGIGQSLSQLAAETLAYRERASQERDRCVANVAALDRRIGDLRVQEEAMGRQIGELDAQLASAAEEERLSQGAIHDLAQQMQAVQAALAEHRQKLGELESWWWVPGYGAYLGIRTLVDDDVAKAENLSNTIRDQQTRLERSVAAMQHAQAIRGEIDTQRGDQVRTLQQFSAMREQTAGKMTELRSMTAFLASAEVFWGKAEQVVRLRAQEKQADLELLVSMLGQDLTLTDFDAEYRPEAKTLEEALVEFAQSIDRGTNFLLENVTEYCGGPDEAG